MLMRPIKKYSSLQVVTNDQSPYGGTIQVTGVLRLNNFDYIAGKSLLDCLAIGDPLKDEIANVPDLEQTLSKFYTL